MQNYLPACKIVSTHGVRGEMKALPLCDGAAFLAKFKRLFTSADGAGETRVLGVRAQGNVILLRLDGVGDMDAARAQVGRVYYLAKADARLPKGRYFIDDLLGCDVVDAETGRVYGRLTNVARPAAQDIYTVPPPPAAAAVWCCTRSPSLTACAPCRASAPRRAAQSRMWSF